VSQPSLYMHTGSCSRRRCALALGVSTAVAVLALGPALARAAAAPVSGAELQALSIDGCSGLPFPHRTRTLLWNDEIAVDPQARFWTLDRPGAYERSLEDETGDIRSIARYRIGSGILRVTAELSPDLEDEVVRLELEEPIEATHLQVYLPGVELPCRRVTHYRVVTRERADVDLAALATFDTLLHQSTELLYEHEFERARELLERAMQLDAGDPGPYWMLARLIYVAQEERVPEGSLEQRLEAYREAERYASLAVEAAPTEPEGYLWQAIARGRLLTAQGNLRTAISGLVGGRGPAWLEETLQKAVSLPENFRFFGDSTRGDALYALAQFYRLAPDAWYMGLLGTRGNIDRAVELLDEVVERHPSRLEYRKELAVALLCRGAPEDQRAARRHLERALTIPVITRIDAIDHAHVEKLLEEPPTQVCAYSRDGFVEFGR